MALDQHGALLKMGVIVSQHHLTGRLCWSWLSWFICLSTRKWGLLPPFSLSCRDHAGGGSMRFQQWDGTQWTVISDWMAPDQALVRPLVEASAAKYAQDKGITLR